MTTEAADTPEPPLVAPPAGDGDARFKPAAWARVPQLGREGVFAVIVGLGAAGVTALWWHDTAAGTLRSLGDELTAAGRVSGLVGTYLLLVEVLLLARVPILDRLIGMDRLAVWHRRNGEYVIGLLAAHAVAITAGYALSDHRNPFGETGDIILRYPDMLAATVALACLVGIGVVSARAVRPKLAYPTWYFIHLYVYLAVVLAFAHQLSAGDEFATHPLSRALWVAMHLVTAGLLVSYRVVLPVRAALRHRLRVVAVTREGPDVVSLTIGGRRMSELRADAGQFFLWRFLTRDGWWQAHPFSLSAAPDGNELRITVREAGDHSRRISRMKPGTAVVAEGPYGALTHRRRTRSKVLLVAGGIGVTPLRTLFETLPAGPGDLTLLYRANAEEHLVHRHELEDLARRRHARLRYVLGSRDRAHRAMTPDVLLREVPDLLEHDAYVCGSSSFVDWSTDALRRAGLPGRRIHAERFEF